MAGELCGQGCGYCGRCDDDEAFGNWTCTRCGERFYKNRDDYGDWCDACCAVRDAMRDVENARQFMDRR